MVPPILVDFKYTIRIPISNCRVSRMENCRIIETGVFPLPEVLIQHIQSFLDGKEAAQTSVLSKSWYSAWSTCPNLEFDQRHFRNQYEEGFWEFAKKTMQRYEALNLKIESFRLVGVFWPSSDFCLAKELIVKAMGMGVVDFNFQLFNSCETFTLPHEVLESETLVKLSLYKCKIDIRPDAKVCCGELKSLILHKIELEDDVICGLISSCPLIEKLTLIKGNDSRTCELESRNLYKLYKLKSLYLGNVDVDTLFFDNLLANFPCLKDLTFDDCRVSSQSLECITFGQRNFDVTNIRKLSLHFITASRQWESHIFVGYCVGFSTAWFQKQKKMLRCLSFSKISLTLTIWSIKRNSPNYQLLLETAMETVTICDVLPSICSMVLEYLFLSCRPKFITLHYLESGLFSIEKVKNDFLASIVKGNVEGIRKNCLMMNHELEEVDVEFFEESAAERLPKEKKIQFRLGWRGGRG